MIDKNNLPKLYVGAISKNTVDAAIEFSNNTGIPIGFCASRNQINGDKGYCNNWTTYDFVNYVREQNENIVIERDHASEITDDDSLFDIIHIDAFKNGNIVKDTSSIMMKNIPKEMLFEFGTEESRCPYSPDLLDIYIGYLQQLLTRNAWERFVYVVVQPGTAIMDGKNVGEYDPDRLKKFIVVCKKWGKLSKVHNADFLQAPIIKHMFALGVDAINIAPEFGQIESSSMHFSKYDGGEQIQHMLNDNKNCSKWFSKTPDYSTQKDCDLVMHYIYSKPEFVEIKEKYSETSKLDCKIKEKLKKRIWEVLDKSVSTFKQIAFDLDDVICLRPKGHENEGVRKYQYCCPIKEGVELVNKCYRYGYYVKIFTSRGMTQFNGDVAKIYNELFITTKNQLETWGVLHHELIMGKPHADIYVGDEAVRWKPGLTMDGLK